MGYNISMGAEHLGKGTNGGLPIRGYRNRSVEIAETNAWRLFHETVPDFQTFPALRVDPAPTARKERVRKPAPPTAESWNAFKKHVRSLSPQDREKYATELNEKIVINLFNVRINEDNQRTFHVGHQTLDALAYMKSFRKALIVGTYVYPTEPDKLFETVRDIRDTPRDFTFETMLDYRNETMLHVAFRLRLIGATHLRPSGA